MDAPGTLRREVGTLGAIGMGLGSIVGTGVFVSIGVAAGLTGPAVVLATIVAAGVATANGLSSAQLAASHPLAGGTYEYGHRYLTPALGFVAGWTFLSAKVASAATAALGFAGYLRALFGQTPEPSTITLIAVLTVIATTVLVLGGMRRSNAVNLGIVAITLVSLAVFVASALPAFSRASFSPFFAPAAGEGTLRAFLHATALMFVAYTGYGRIATLGEEVHDPARTIPRAIIATLAVSAVLYVAVAAAAVGAVGAAAFSAATTATAAPLQAIARGLGHPAAATLLSIGAMTAMLGVLLNLVLGLSRVVLAMARRGDLPAPFARLRTRHATPTAAVLLTGGLIATAALIGDVKTAWTVSAFTVLVYYAVTNLAALALPPEERRFPRWIAWAGLGACLFLAFWVEVVVWAAGLGWIGLGLLAHLAARRYRRS